MVNDKFFRKWIINEWVIEIANNGYSLVAGADLRTFFCDPLQTYN